MRTVSLKLPESLDERLEAVAAEQGTGKSAVVREALEAYLRQGRRAQPQSCLGLASDLVGCVEGSPDLSYHVKHMKGFGT
jgi:metal-responsive CopG/Arc/MetJ family transcriptional regulator